MSRLVRTKLHVLRVATNQDTTVPAEEGGLAYPLSVGESVQVYLGGVLNQSKTYLASTLDWSLTITDVPILYNTPILVIQEDESIVVDSDPSLYLTIDDTVVEFENLAVLLIEEDEDIDIQTDSTEFFVVADTVVSTTLA